MPINRRKFLLNAITLPSLAIGSSSLFKIQAMDFFRPTGFRRVRPGDPGWPTEESWAGLKGEVNGNLLKLESPFDACKSGSSCDELFKDLKNPYYIGDQPALTQTSGWLDAWTSAPSAYAVAAQSTADIVAAVNFARKNNLRLVVKGGGHSYQGTSCSADSLLVWTRAMNKIVLHDDFVAKGCEGKQAPQPAVTVEAGAIWMHVYDAVTTKAGRYVQGGGCATVGVAGLIQSGGFGSFSKNYGLAAAALLEAEVVTADGKIHIVNACNEPDLFWAIKGGGGGSFGVVTKLTLKTRKLPEFFGAAFGVIKANSDTAYKNLISKIVDFYNDKLFNPHWGEQIRFYTNNTIRISMMFHGLNQQEAKDSWQSLQQWVDASPGDFSWQQPLTVLALPARHLWDGAFLRQYTPQTIGSDDRPGAPAENIYWAGDGEDSGQYLLAYRSAWMPASLLEKSKQGQLAEALFQASRYWTVSLHFNKGLAGAPPEEIAAARNTATNPDVLNAFALAIIAGNKPPAYPGIEGHEPDKEGGRKDAERINKSMDELLKAAPAAGSYVSESNFFEKNWKKSFWGSNYPKLAAIKKKYDPQGLFFVHHGVGSEDWSDDGFIRVR